MGLPRPFADAGTLLRYVMGESTCSLAGPRPMLVGRAIPLSVLDLAGRGACLDVVLNVGALPSLQGAVPEVVLAPPATSRALFPGCTIQPLGEGALLAFPAGAAPPGLLTALGAFFPMEIPPRAGLAGGARQSRAMGGRARPGPRTRCGQGRRVPPQLIAAPPPLPPSCPSPPAPLGAQTGHRGGPSA